MSIFDFVKEHYMPMLISEKDWTCKCGYRNYYLRKSCRNCCSKKSEHLEKEEETISKFDVIVN
jgi:hypothetical protein